MIQNLGLPYPAPNCMFTHMYTKICAERDGEEEGDGEEEEKKEMKVKIKAQTFTRIK